MDSDQNITVAVDFSDMTQTWGENGHSDSFQISSGSLTDTLNIGASAPYQYGTTIIPPIVPQNQIYTFSNTCPNTSPSYNDITMGSFNPSNKISINGPDADIEINGESVVSMLRDIRDRLNMIQVSEEMEQEWDELRTLREKYEAKLIECREKSKMWNTLKAMPAPEIP